MRQQGVDFFTDNFAHGLDVFPTPSADGHNPPYGGDRGRGTNGGDQWPRP